MSGWFGADAEAGRRHDRLQHSRDLMDKWAPQLEVVQPPPPPPDRQHPATQPPPPVEAHPVCWRMGAFDTCESGQCLATSSCCAYEVELYQHASMVPYLRSRMAKVQERLDTQHVVLFNLTERVERTRYMENYHQKFGFWHQEPTESRDLYLHDGTTCPDFAPCSCDDDAATAPVIGKVAGRPDLVFGFFGCVTLLALLVARLGYVRYSNAQEKHARQKKRLVDALNACNAAQMALDKEKDEHAGLRFQLSDISRNQTRGMLTTEKQRTILMENQARFEQKEAVLLERMSELRADLKKLSTTTTIGGVVLPTLSGTLSGMRQLAMGDRRLHVTVLQCAGLKQPVRKEVRKQNISVKLNIDGHRHTYSTQHGPNPFWGHGAGETFVCTALDYAPQKVTVQAFDEDSSAQVLIGEYVMDLSRHDPKKDWAAVDWCPLTDATEQQVGQVKVHFRWTKPAELFAVDEKSWQLRAKVIECSDMQYLETTVLRCRSNDGSETSDTSVTVQVSAGEHDKDTRTLTTPPDFTLGDTVTVGGKIHSTGGSRLEFTGLPRRPQQMKIGMGPMNPDCTCDVPWPDKVIVTTAFRGALTSMRVDKNLVIQGTDKARIRKVNGQHVTDTKDLDEALRKVCQHDTHDNGEEVELTCSTDWSRDWDSVEWYPVTDAAGQKIGEVQLYMRWNAGSSSVYATLHVDGVAKSSRTVYNRAQSPVAKWENGGEELVFVQDGLHPPPAVGIELWCEDPLATDIDMMTGKRIAVKTATTEFDKLIGAHTFSLDAINVNKVGRPQPWTGNRTLELTDIYGRQTSRISVALYWEKSPARGLLKGKADAQQTFFKKHDARKRKACCMGKTTGKMSDKTKRKEIRAMGFADEDQIRRALKQADGGDKDAEHDARHVEAALQLLHAGQVEGDLSAQAHAARMKRQKPLTKLEMCVSCGGRVGKEATKQRGTAQRQEAKKRSAQSDLFKSASNRDLKASASSDTAEFFVSSGGTNAPR